MEKLFQFLLKRSRMYGTTNNVKDYHKAQGVSAPQDLSVQILRNPNLRYATLENSSRKPIGIAITTYPTGPLPKIRFVLKGGEIKHLGLNSHGSDPQYLWLLDISSGKPVGNIQPLHRHSNSFVIREGLNMWFIQYFARPSYRAAF